MATEQFGDIVIAPRVLEKIIAIATAKVEGVYSLENKSVSDSLSKRSLGRGVYLHTEEDGQVPCGSAPAKKFAWSGCTICRCSHSKSNQVCSL